MGAGPLVVTYPLTGRSRAIVEEERDGTAEAIYLVDLLPAARAHALGRAGAVLSHDTSKELPDEIPLIRNARLLQFTAAGVDWVPTRDLPWEFDASKYYVIIPDALGHGRSSKPSDGLKVKFPQYNYADMVDAQYRLLSEGLGIRHVRLIIGNSMGGMHFWVWGERYPRYMDTLVPMASQPTAMASRNWMLPANDAGDRSE